MFDDLVNGRTKFHNVFHYPTETWGDVALIGWLIDGAALVTQKALLDSSYAPYVRAMRRICAEESLHLRHGEDMALELVAGTAAQREMFQDAVNRWWEPIMHFFGPPSKARDVLLEWGIKTRTNEDLRQEFFSTYVPKLWDLGITVPDPELRWDEAAGEWIWSRAELGRVLAGRSRERADDRDAARATARPCGTPTPGSGRPSPASRRRPPDGGGRAAVDVWDVLGKRTAADEWTLVGRREGARRRHGAAAGARDALPSQGGGRVRGAPARRRGGRAGPGHVAGRDARRRDRPVLPPAGGVRGRRRAS